MIVFGMVWIGILLVAYFASGRRVGLVMFFAGAVTLYTVFPTVFYQNDEHLILPLVAGLVLAVLGYAAGFREDRLMREVSVGALVEQARKVQLTYFAAMGLASLGLGLLLVLQTNFYFDLGSYESRIAFQGEKGPLAFLLNQIVIALAVFIILAWQNGRKKAAIILTLFCIAWAFYSHAKLSLLTAGGAWLGILITASWREKGAKKILSYMILFLPLSLFVMMIHSVVRGSGELAIGRIASLFVFQLFTLGVDGVNVGDFDGPYQVLKRTMETSDLDLRFGATYIEQLPVLLPRVVRGDFQDLTEQFAIRELGSDYTAGLGFAYSPWAEGFSNFHLFGFFTEALFIGWINRVVWHAARRAQISLTVVVMLQIVLIILCQRGYILGHVKNVIVFVLPLLILVGLFRLIRDTLCGLRTEANLWLDYKSPARTDSSINGSDAG